MKKPLLLLLIFAATMSAAQSQDDSVAEVKIPKRARIIYVKHVGFDAIVNQLKKEGFKIDQKVDNVIIRTKYRLLPGTIRQIRYNIRYSDSTAQIIGTIYEGYNFSRMQERIITYKDFLLKKPFEVMNKFALALNGEISYEK